MASTTTVEPRRRWSVDAFSNFWRAPDASRARGVLTEDVVGYWPRPIGTVRGPEDYIHVIASMLVVCPDFTVRVNEHASSGELTFIRWTASGTGRDGPFDFTGCDRVRTRDGHVCENYIFCDDPFWARVASAMAENRTL